MRCLCIAIQLVSCVLEFTCSERKNCSIPSKHRSTFHKKEPVENLNTLLSHTDVLVQSLVNLARGLTADEKIAADTLSVLKAEEKLHQHLGELAIKDLDAGAMAKLHSVNKQLKVAAAAHHAAPHSKKMVVHLTKGDLNTIVRETVARLKSQLNIVHPPSAHPPHPAARPHAHPAAAHPQLHAVHIPPNMHVAHSPLLEDAAAEPAEPAEGEAGGAQNATDTDDDDEEEEDEEEKELPKANFNQMPVKMTQSTLKKVAKAKDGSRTSMAEPGDPYEEIGVENPDLEAAEEQDRAYAQKMPKWSKPGRFFSNNSGGCVVCSKVVWSKLV
jgi:hypothetical protein